MSINDDIIHRLKIWRDHSYLVSEELSRVSGDVYLIIRWNGAYRLQVREGKRIFGGSAVRQFILVMLVLFIRYY